MVALKLNPANNPSRGQQYCTIVKDNEITQTYSAQKNIPAKGLKSKIKRSDSYF